QDLRVDRRDVPIADVRDRLRVQPTRHDPHRLDRDSDLLGSRMDRGLVDLDVARARGFEVAGLVSHELCKRQHRVTPGWVRLVVRPIQHRVWTSEHALPGLDVSDWAYWNHFT